jgi:hypothetical protein
MKTTSVVLAFLFVSAAALPAAASTSNKSDASARSTVVQEGATGSAQPRMICRRQETTGARTGGERICLTKDQWRIVDNGGSVTTYQKRVR